MLVKFLSAWDGGGLGSVNYLLNERTENNTARVIKGSKSQTRAVIEQIKFKHKTCFGVLSFAEKAYEISEQAKLEIIDEFERALFGDFMRGRVNCLWVEHSDKNGRLELNVLIPKIDLVTGKSYNPYYSEHDQYRIDLIKRIINNTYRLQSPDDPTREQTIKTSKKNLEYYQNLEQVDKKLHELVKNGFIQSRDHMIELLDRSGIEVTRASKNSISIKLPNQKVKNRLSGGIYSESFKCISDLRGLGEESVRRIKAYHSRDTQAECERYRKELERIIAKRDKFNKKKFARTNARDDIYKQKEQSLEHNLNLDYIINDGVDSGILNQPEIYYEATNKTSQSRADRTASNVTEPKGAADRADESVADTKPVETLSAVKRSNELLYGDTDRDGYTKTEQQILHTYKDGVDDDIRRGIIKRKRELSDDNQTREGEARERYERFIKQQQGINPRTQFPENREQEIIGNFESDIKQIQRELQEAERNLQERIGEFKERFKQRVRGIREQIGRIADKFRANLKDITDMRQ
ncbi:relaxase/mobilization nuclease domain-containing protein [Campylobacter sp. RM9344]|uniref:Relaxase/mobilization nuclease domain-containing protein n=1 Tax=Campylobacter californiensis TaxID=1032243 RepID=A0AAW3ZVF0_9BACT|nr:relaxase/mobilization nuclease domain-containing protein [Campylobacter sp. RM9337]MBE3029704.1 relaxase/mobilization nuclease domain-containing protein [Campylobacter sp. RM9344]MBE3608634.1 relaxase/mobilization nuclease domain-containing protein [Campylobacter sp. RM9337]